MINNKNNLDRSWVSCWTSRRRVLRCPPGRCSRPSRSERWASRLQGEEEEEEEEEGGGRRRRRKKKSVIITSRSDVTEVTSCRLSPAVFCFLMGGASEGLFCMPVATTTCDVDTAIMAGAAGVCACVMATAVFLTVFFGDSEEMGTLLSSYNFLFTVLFIWALQEDNMNNMRTPDLQVQVSTQSVLQSADCGEGRDQTWQPHNTLWGFQCFVQYNFFSFLLS